MRNSKYLAFNIYRCPKFKDIKPHLQLCKLIQMFEKSQF